MQELKNKFCQGKSKRLLIGTRALLPMDNFVGLPAETHLTAVCEPLPSFLVVGRKSAGKTRLLEALIGQPFNTTTTRRPIIFEIRSAPSLIAPKWYLYGEETEDLQEVCFQIALAHINEAHTCLGLNVSIKPMKVYVETPHMSDCRVIDMPGFRELALDPRQQRILDTICKLNMEYMWDPRNVILCVEHADDAANLSTLERVREVDPGYKRTILVMNKLDKYYDDLTATNINNWMSGYGALPASLVRFIFTLPSWPAGEFVSRPLVQLCDDKHIDDVRQLLAKGLEMKYITSIGFKHFSSYMKALASCDPNGILAATQATLATQDVDVTAHEYGRAEGR